ncbi:MAG: hypothetical protein QOD78_1875 [Chloroflexota bacterium]|nr:hypothetical protein [Chloroflexota bacterium]
MVADGVWPIDEHAGRARNGGREMAKGGHGGPPLAAGDPGRGYPVLGETVEASPDTSSQILTCRLSRMKSPPMTTVRIATVIG